MFNLQSDAINKQRSKNNNGKKTNFPLEVKDALERRFQQQKYLEPTERKSFALELGLADAQVSEKLMIRSLMGPGLMGGWVKRLNEWMNGEVNE